VAPRYLEESEHEIGVPNVVTSVLASYRGFDTFGETAVVFTAAIGVMILLSAMRRKDRFGEEQWGEEGVPNLYRGFVGSFWLDRDGRMRPTSIDAKPLHGADFSLRTGLRTPSSANLYMRHCCVA